MPPTSRAFTVPDEEGNYNVYMNEDLDEKAKIKSLQHEIKHIERDDFNSGLPRNIVESKFEGDV